MRALSALLLASLTGCTTFEGNRGMVPFLEVYHDQPVGFPRSSVSPAASASPPPPSQPPWAIEPPRGREVVLRPLGSVFLGTNQTRLKLLWPLGDFSWEGGQRTLRFVTFWYRKRQPELEGGPSTRWMLFPFLYRGRSATQGNYFAFLPLGGKLRGFLGWDEIDFYALPAYWHTRYGEAHSLHVLFPFYNRVWGAGRTGSRLWPFYGRYRSWTADGRERYDKRFVLWPFFYFQRNELNTRYPSRLFFIFPFYGRSESARTLTQTYLWPIFHTTLDKRTGKKVHFGLIIPYRFAEGKFDLWPLFGVMRYRQEATTNGTGTYRRHRHFIIWPLERYDRAEDDRRLTVRFWIVPLYWRFRDFQKTDGEEELEWKVWPLMRYRRLKDESDFHLPSPLWFRQEKILERLYSRLWRLFLYHQDARQEGWEVLYALVSYRNLKQEQVGVFSVLGGFFERRTSPEGTRFRFFYLPWR